MPGRVTLDLAMAKRARSLWTKRETRTVDRYARILANREFRQWAAAMTACQASLRRVRPELSPGRSFEAVRHKLRLRARALGLRFLPSDRNTEEKKAVSDCASAFIRGEYPGFDSAVSDCCDRLERASPGIPHPEEAVRTQLLGRLDSLASHLGFKSWTPDEERIVDCYAQARVEGKFRHVKDAVPPCMDELERLRDEQPERFRCIPARSMATVAVRIGRAERRKRPVRPLQRREKWELEILDSLARQYMDGAFSTLREAADAAHARIAAGWRRRRRGRGPVELRTRPAVRLGLRERLDRIGYRPRFQPPRWSAEETAVLGQLLDEYVRTQSAACPLTLEAVAAMLRGELKSLGYRRTLGACRDRIKVERRRRLEVVMRELGVLEDEGEDRGTVSHLPA